MTDAEYSFAFVTWADRVDEIMSVRRVVFIEEQNVPEEIEIDDDDPVCSHILATDRRDTPVGTARLSSSGRIGRMAVLSDHRGRGVATEMLARLIELGRDKGITEFRLHAQTQAVDFYQKSGFQPTGDLFEEANIPHITMVLTTSPDP